MQIQNTINNELIPSIKVITDCDNLNNDLKASGDILSKIINYAEQGLSKTGGVEKELENAKDPNYIFGAILNKCTMELAQYIPVPVIS